MSSPSTVNPQRFGAWPAMYAHALSSVSFKNTCQLAIKIMRPPVVKENVGGEPKHIQLFNQLKVVQH